MLQGAAKAVCRQPGTRCGVASWKRMFLMEGSLRRLGVRNSVAANSCAMAAVGFEKLGLFRRGAEIVRHGALLRGPPRREHGKRIGNHCEPACTRPLADVWAVATGRGAGARGAQTPCANCNRRHKQLPQHIIYRAHNCSYHHGCWPSSAATHHVSGRSAPIFRARWRRRSTCAGLMAFPWSPMLVSGGINAVTPPQFTWQGALLWRF